MANKSEKDLLEEIKRIQEEANKKAKELKMKAKKIKQENLAELGELTIKFLKNEIDLDELKTFATNQNLITIKEEKHD